LTIRGERHAGVPESATRHYHQLERGHGPFSRAFEFDGQVRHDNITADLRDGVLTVTLPKVTLAPRRIDVQ
jgi:HSP20 family protein